MDGWKIYLVMRPTSNRIDAGMRGLHLIVDMYGCGEDVLRDKNYIYNVLLELPDYLKLTRLSEPFVEEYDNPSPGVSGFVIIGESHISIHTFVEDGLATVDVYACKEFNVEDAILYLTMKFSPERFQKHILKRGD
ncbi:MAG: adenosylmethionine decarboxylase [Nitrososphaerota archaeon]